MTHTQRVFDTDIVCYDTFRRENSHKDTWQRQVTDIFSVETTLTVLNQARFVYSSASLVGTNQNRVEPAPKQGSPLVCHRRCSRPPTTATRQHLGPRVSPRLKTLLAARVCHHLITSLTTNKPPKMLLNFC